MQVQQTPNVKEIGNSINSMNLEYAEITKYSNGHNTKSDNEEDKIILETLAALKDPEEFKIWRENNSKENPRVFLKEKGYYNMLDS